MAAIPELRITVPDVVHVTSAVVDPYPTPDSDTALVRLTVAETDVPCLVGTAVANADIDGVRDLLIGHAVCEMRAVLEPHGLRVDATAIGQGGPDG